jgi:FkbM family methyltransferase
LKGESNSQLYGLTRSLLIYYGIPGRGRRLRRFYRQFINPGDLCFDIGAHVGNRMRAFLSLGARVVALEPQANFYRFLRRWYGSNKDVVLHNEAVGAQPGKAEMLVSSSTPTVSSLSGQWVAAVKERPEFSWVEWDQKQIVNITTLDTLIEDYGLPAFCKVDVEGYELEVLQGLSKQVPVISFEYLPATLDIALACILRLDSLGPYEFNLTIGESGQFAISGWLRGDQLAAHLGSLPARSRPGDVYARLAPDSFT